MVRTSRPRGSGWEGPGWERQGGWGHRVRCAHPWPFRETCCLGLKLSSVQPQCRRWSALCQVRFFCTTRLPSALQVALFYLLEGNKVCASWLGLRSAVDTFHVQGSFFVGGPCFASLLAASCLVCHQDPILVLTDASREPGISTDFSSWGTSGTLCMCVKCVVFCAPNALGLDGFYCFRGCK